VTAVLENRDTAMRRRIIEAAGELTIETGWASVTMGRVAEVVGVSRQTVYNEVGSKPALGEAMVLAQLADFMTVVERSFDEHPDDPAAAVEGSVRRALELAAANPLVREVVSATHGANTDLLPFLTTRSDALLRTAKDIVAARLAPMTPRMLAAERTATVDVIVRVVLSHVMQPSGTPRRSAASVTLVVAPMLRG
jgi:AcrR family transcriptional regulator